MNVEIRIESVGGTGMEVFLKCTDFGRETKDGRDPLCIRKRPMINASKRLLGHDKMIVKYKKVGMGVG